MNRKTIRETIMNEVDDQELDADTCNQYIQEADNAIQTFTPEEYNLPITFDYWDYLKEFKTWTTTVASQVKFLLPENFRSFIELRVGEDTEKYLIVDYSMRDRYDDHICWIVGKYLYIKTNSNAVGTVISMLYTKICDEFSSDQDEPEVETVYHGALVAYGKSKYYNTQGDSELETKNMDAFTKWMLRKKRDQDLNRMKQNPQDLEMSESIFI